MLRWRCKWRKIPQIHLLTSVLFRVWQGIPKQEMELDRFRLMRMAKISARSTYDKIMHDLHAFGYIIYDPGKGQRKSKTRLKKLSM